MKTKLICYCNTNSVFTSNILLNSLIAVVDDKIEIVSVIETGLINNKFSFISRLKRQISLVKNLKILNSYLVSVLSVSVERICQRNHIDYHVPADLKINTPSHLNYIDRLTTKNHNLVAVIFGCPQIFKKDLLSKYKYIINYHDSYLPYYRGLNATAWSRFENKDRSGYTFHIVNEKIDDGRIIFQELLPYQLKWNIHQHLYNKTLIASRKIEKIKQFILTGRFENIQEQEYSSQDNYYAEKKKSDLIEQFNKTDNSLEKAKIKKAFGATC